MAIRWTDTTPPRVLPPRAAPPDGARVAIAAAVDRAVLAHLRGARVERGGLLLGIAYADPTDGRVSGIDILASVPAPAADGTPVSLRMDASVWRSAQSRLTAAADAGATGWRIVGWYHSHPGLGAFFSETDRRTQRAFFGHDYGVGWVVDPLDGDEAFFLGRDCRPIRRVAASDAAGS